MQEGDTLSSIARNELGKVSRWAEIYQLNREALGKDYDYLTPGMRLVAADTRFPGRRPHHARAHSDDAAAADRGTSWAGRGDKIPVDGLAIRLTLCSPMGFHLRRCSPSTTVFFPITNKSLPPLPKIVSRAPLSWSESMLDKSEGFLATWPVARR